MRFNTQAAGTKTVNLAGGKAYKVNKKFELASILLTSLMQNQHYRSANETEKRIEELLDEVDPVFAAKAAVFARREFGLRSITHVASALIAKKVKGESWTKGYFSKVFKRPDDMLETVAYYTNKYGKRPFPNALKKGVRKTLEGLGEYNLAKYRGEGATIKMVDLVNLVHPKETPAIKKLIKGELKSTETWESKLTKAGQTAETDEEKAELKDAAWKSLLAENKLGYFAALRNVRNIVEQAPDAIPALCELLTDREQIKKCLVLPFQFMRALKAVEAATKSDRRVINAIMQAIDISLSNCPVFPGKTLVCIDCSGSMTSGAAGRDMKPIEAASILGAVLYKTNDADMLLFAEKAQRVNIRATDSIATVTDHIQKLATGGGTNFPSIFWEIQKDRYDRIIILSDMQGWMEGGGCARDFEAYKRITGAKPYLYSMDLTGYGTLQIPEDKVFLLAGFSEKIFDVFKTLEDDKDALIKRIEAEQL